MNILIDKLLNSNCHQDKTNQTVNELNYSQSLNKYSRNAKNTNKMKGNKKNKYSLDYGRYYEHRNAHQPQKTSQLLKKKGNKSNFILFYFIITNIVTKNKQTLRYQNLLQFQQMDNQQKEQQNKQQPLQTKIQTQQCQIQLIDNTQNVVWIDNHQPKLADTIQLSNSSYEWKDKQMGQICKNMLEWKTTALWLGDHKQPNLLDQIAHINFSKLIRIDISGNEITSLQLLYVINFPELKQLYMQSNHIHCIKNMRRCNWPNLYFIGYGSNYIQDCWSLTEMQLSQLTWLGCESEDCPIFSNDIRWTVKLNANKLNFLQLHNHNRIRQDAADKTLTKRYLSLPEVGRL